MTNSFLQFYSTNKFLGQNDPYWGMRILDDILKGTDWEHSGNFPRIAMCDFQVINAQLCEIAIFDDKNKYSFELQTKLSVASRPGTVIFSQNSHLF